MTPTYADWPFRAHTRSDADEKRWWDLCYVRAAADAQLEGVYHWFVLAGRPGSGKTVARRAWEREQAADCLVLLYPPERWPGSPQAWFPDNPSHLAQMMATAGLAVAELLQREPQRLDHLNEFQREFLRALLEFMGGERHYRRFAAALPRAQADALLSVTVHDNFFGDGRSRRDVQGQIEELRQLLNGLGRRRAVYVIDPPTPLGPVNVAGLAELLGWLDLTDNPGLAVAAVAPDDLLTDALLLARSRGRVGLVYTDWSPAACHEVAERHMRAALPEGPAAPLSALLPPGALDELDALVAAEHGGRPSPAAWVGLAEALLYLVCRPGSLPLAPLPPDQLPLLKATYFQRHVPLRLDAGRCAVWRGQRLISLDQQHFNFLELLLRRGRAVSWDDDGLRQLAGSKSNVHSIASRTRRAIEPVEATPVYLHNRRSIDGGYWLENCIAVPVDRPVTGS